MLVPHVAPTARRHRHERMTTHEVNFDGLVGPTHNYAGLAFGNLASQAHRDTASEPRAAALQGLAKIKRLADLGLKQAVLPPHERPHLGLLREVGFTGSDERVLAAAQRDEPRLLAAACSASAMWTANAATVTPAPDAADGRTHFTAANLVTEAHRAIEADFTDHVLRRLFPDEQRFAHHGPLPANAQFRDEGAANHTRLCPDLDQPGLELFTYGIVATDRTVARPREHPPRQTLEACRAIARRHGLPPDRAVFVQQHPDAIDAGVFHNDVISVGHRDVFFYQSGAFIETAAFIEELRRRFEAVCAAELRCLEVRAEDVPYADAVEAYLFNSQLLTLPDGATLLLCPENCRRVASVRGWLEGTLPIPGVIDRVEYVDVNQSMRNGGGPACLRLRVVLDDEQLAAAHGGVMLTDALYERLVAWVNKHYRERIEPADLADPKLLEESRAALDELTWILDLGNLYAFQQR